MNTSNPHWTTRRKQTCDPITIQCGWNNKYISNNRNMASNENERSYSDLVRWITKTQNSGPFLWLQYMRIAIIKIEQNSTDYVIKHRDNYSKVTDHFLDNLLSTFDDVLSMKGMFEEAHEYGYQEILLKPFKIQDYSYYFDIGMIKPKPWGSKNDASILSFALNELKIFQNDFTMNDINEEIVLKCRRFCVDGDQYNLEFIKNKLITLLFLYIVHCFIHILMDSKWLLVCIMYTEKNQHEMD